MPQRSSEVKVRGVIDALKADIAVKEISQQVELSETTIYRIRLNLDLYNQPYAPRFARSGRPRALTRLEEEVRVVILRGVDFLTELQAILSYLSEHPSAYIDEVGDFLAFEYGVDTAERNIYNVLARRKWSRKVARRQFLEADRELRTAWIAHQITLRSSELIFIDETGSNRRTGYRRFGWSPQGVPALGRLSSGRGERWSICPALTVGGYLPEPLIVEGSVTKELFTDWVIESVLPYCEAGRTILIMDNCAIHKDKELEVICSEHGVVVDFLPPYCPDFNPIEFSFNELKAFIRRSNYEIPSFEVFGEFLAWCLEHVARPEVCKRYFEKAGYH